MSEHQYTYVREFVSVCQQSERAAITLGRLKSYGDITTIIRQYAAAFAIEKLFTAVVNLILWIKTRMYIRPVIPPFEFTNNVLIYKSIPLHIRGQSLMAIAYLLNNTNCIDESGGFVSIIYTVDDSGIYEWLDTTCRVHTKLVCSDTLTIEHYVRTTHLKNPPTGISNTIHYNACKMLYKEN